MIKSYSDPCSVWDPLANKVAIARKEAPDPDNADLRLPEEETYTYEKGWGDCPKI